MENQETISQLDSLTADMITSTDKLAIENEEGTFCIDIAAIIEYTKAVFDKELTGKLSYFTLDAPTKDWLLCNGESYYIEEYPNLAEYLGEDFIDAEDPSKFKVPNTQGYFIRTLDPSKTIDVDERTSGSIQEDSLQTHQHSLASDVSLAGAKQQAYSGSNGGYFNATSVSKKTVSIDDARTASETRPKNISYKQYIHI